MCIIKINCKKVYFLKIRIFLLSLIFLRITSDEEGFSQFQEARFMSNVLGVVSNKGIKITAFYVTWDLSLPRWLFIIFSCIWKFTYVKCKVGALKTENYQKNETVFLIKCFLFQQMAYNMLLYGKSAIPN